jgi:SAM-dependent methyltransferase
MPTPRIAICPVCKSDNTEGYIEKSFHAFKSTWFKCGEEGTLFISPFPALNELERYYKCGYLTKKSPGAVSHRFRFSEENKETVFREYEMSLSDVGITFNILHNKKILDYGCANGFFLDCCFTNGCRKRDLCGYDIADDLLNIVRSKRYNILAKERDYFDFVFLWDVIEHIPDPHRFLKTLKSLLNRNGSIIVQTPRVGILSEMLKENWEHFLPLEHLVLYTRESLLFLFRKFGFHPIKAWSFGGNAPSGIIPKPYKNAYDTLAKKTDNGSTQVVHFILWKVGGKRKG